MQQFKVCVFVRVCLCVRACLCVCAYAVAHLVRSYVHLCVGACTLHERENTRVVVVSVVVVRVVVVKFKEVYNVARFRAARWQQRVGTQMIAVEQN